MEKVHLVTDPRSGDSRGFAFVTMGSIAQAEECVEYLNRGELDGRTITVEKVRTSYNKQTKLLGQHWGVV